MFTKGKKYIELILNALFFEWHHCNTICIEKYRYVLKNLNKLSYYEFAVEFSEDWRDEKQCHDCFVTALDIITKDKRNKIKNVQAKYYPRQY
jgi:hypothetical protein